MSDTWTFHNNSAPSPTKGNDLNGLHFVKVVTGGVTHYELWTNGFGSMLGKEKGPLSVTFKDILHKGETWNILVEKLPAGKDGDGKWHKKGDTEGDTDPEDGSYTAQAGSGRATYPGEVASSAKAG